MSEINQRIASVISEAVNKSILKKIVFSMAADPHVKKAEASVFSQKNEVKLCINTFTDDGKCTRKNYSLDEGTTLLSLMAEEQFKRTNIITTCGECSVMVSQKGKVTLLNKIKLCDSVQCAQVDIPVHNKEKQYILSGERSLPFLKALGICNDKGNIFDKKMAKYRQINKFLEMVEGVYPSLPKEGELVVCDFCCGKSYLTFAVYHYLTEIKCRTVRMYGVDLKKDVIEFCTETAKQLGYNGMTFINDDIYNFNLPSGADMVISLHACDIATDIVLINALRLNAKIILSTPCCHHELNRQISAPELDFISRHSILKQKLADAATDSLRALMLEAHGYEVSVFELIDPEETPKNVMIRAIYKNTHDSVRMRAYEEYEKACRFLGVSPFISNARNIKK